MITLVPDSKGAAKTVKLPLEAWSLLFPDSLLEKIVTHTNEEIRQNYPDNVKCHYQETDVIEIKSLIGLLYFSGFKKDARTDSCELWSTEFGTSLCKCTMFRIRFAVLNIHLRFDDKSTRVVRIKNDRFAPIREIWEMFVTNCNEYYTPSNNCTLDEQLIRCKGKCPFKIYRKRERHGMKIIMLNDSKTSYMLNAIPYVSHIRNNKPESFQEFFVRTVTTPIHNTNRTVTCNNWFSSVRNFRYDGR